MQSIIQQIVQEYTKRFFEKAVSHIFDLDTAASLLLPDCKEMAAHLLSAIISEMNRSFRGDKEARRSHGLVLKEKDRPRTLYTELGEVTFARDYYYNKETASYETPLDAMLSLNARERVGGTVLAKLLLSATETSYQKSTKEVTNGEISRQTVYSVIRECPELEISPPLEKRDPEAIHIYADEDHVHLQREKKARGKKSRKVSLITVTEGIENVSGRRNRTIRPVHFVAGEEGTGELWKSVDGYLMTACEESAERPIYIYGDGAGWIRAGAEALPNAFYVMDKFHFRKALKEATRMNPGARLSQNLIQAARTGNEEMARRSLAEWTVPFHGKEREKASGYKRYFLNNWDGIVRSYMSFVTGSCTEGEVSHVLSERFSRDPMGWSERNLNNLSKARVYALNGGTITKETLGRTEAEKYREIAERLAREVMGKCDWSLFEGGGSNLTAGTGFRYTENGKRVRLVC